MACTYQLADVRGRVSIHLREPYEALNFMAPLSQERAKTLVRFLATDRAGTILDLGSGWAELLLRVLEASPTAHGIGIDLDQAAVEHGRRLAACRGLTDRVTLRVEDAKTLTHQNADALICVGASQIWGPSVHDQQPLDYVSALAALRSVVTPGDRVLYGEAVWTQSPTVAGAATLSGRLDEFVSTDELVELAVAQGFTPVQVDQATLAEWDEFEAAFGARYAAWLAEHEPDHPDAAEVRRRAARQRHDYVSGYRGVLGMAYLGLVAS